MAAAGKCVSSCPSNTFSSTGSCLTCHPDCATCSGGGFNQCTSCPSNRPVLTNGRCLPTCGQSQFFDSTSSACRSCDSSCSSCSGPGPSNCLACSSSTQVLAAGSCVAANCSSTSNVVAGLGVCLSDLVVTQPSGTTNVPPLPSISGLDNPTVINTPSHRLAWWQILLMALGCAFIFIVIIWLFRRHQRKKNAAKQAAEAQLAKGLLGAKKEKTGWRWKLIRFGEKLFCHTPSRRVPVIRVVEAEDVKLNHLRMMEEARPVPSFAATDYNHHHMYPSRDGEDQDLVQLIGSYNDPLPETYYYSDNRHVQVHLGDHRSSILSDSSSQHTAPSMYSQVTGLPHNVPEPRQPLKSRFSMSTFATNEIRKKNSQSAKKAFWKWSFLFIFLFFFVAFCWFFLSLTSSRSFFLSKYTHHAPFSSPPSLQ